MPYSISFAVLVEGTLPRRPTPGEPPPALDASEDLQVLLSFKASLTEQVRLKVEGCLELVCVDM